MPSAMARTKSRANTTYIVISTPSQTRTLPGGTNPMLFQTSPLASSPSGGGRIWHDRRHPTSSLVHAPTSSQDRVLRGALAEGMQLTLMEEVTLEGMMVQGGLYRTQN